MKTAPPDQKGMLPAPDTSPLLTSRINRRLISKKSCSTQRALTLNQNLQEVSTAPTSSPSQAIIMKRQEFHAKSSLSRRSSNHSLSKVLLASLLVLCSAFSPLHSVSGASKSSSNNEKRVVCYYTNWSAYRQGPAKFLPDNINPYLCTHLVYAFGGLTSDSGIKPFDKYQDIDKGGYTKFNGLKTYNKVLKTMIAIGGWNEGSRRFSSLVAEPEKRKTFIKHAIRFLRQYQFDGLDLDWEYPASREGGVPEDKANYAQFIKELREAFEEESKSTGRSRLLLTVAVPAGIEWIQKGFDIPTINRNIDFFNLLTYDYHASTEPNANHHAPLKARDGISEYDWKGQLNIEYSINYYLKEGADPDKLVVGLPTYGRSYNLFNVDSYDIDAPSSGPGTKGKYTKEPGYLAYYEICEGIKSGEWRVENAESDSQGPHAVKHDQWVGYDDTRMMAIKSKWVKENGLGGIMFWSIDNDDFRGTCHNKPFPLIEAAKLAYLTADSSSSRPSSATSKLSKTSSLLNRNSNNRFSSSNNRRVTTPAPPSTTTGASSKRRNSKGRNKNKGKKNRKTTTALFTPSTTTTTTTTTTTPPPVTYNPLSTPAPPTTPDPGVDFECKEDGFFPHPRDCKKYFWCLDAPGLGLVAHHFTCPAGLFFNKNTDSCDYARNVPCKEKKATEATTTTAAPTTPSTTTPTTTTRRTTTTTTTTTPAPEEEDEYEYDDEEEDTEEEKDDEPEKDEEAIKKVISSTRAGAGNKNGNKPKNAEEINDIKNLLKLIRKLGGVEELEKYLDENPSVAAAIKDEYDTEEEDKPSTKTTTVSSILTRNRFSAATRPKFGSPVAAGSLKYTSIQRNRPATTEKAVTAEEDEEPEASKEPPKRKTSSSLFSSSNRPKYVTLSRNSNRDSKSTDSKKSSSSSDEPSSSSSTTPSTTTSSTSTSTAPTTEKSTSSSTQTSVVVRFSGDDEKLLDEISNNKDDKKKKGDGNKDSTSEETDAELYEDDDDNNDDDNTDKSDEKTNSSSDGYVTVSRPYAKVSGTSSSLVGGAPQAISNKKLQESSSSSRLRYVQLSRPKTIDLKTESLQEVGNNKKEVVEVAASSQNNKESQEDLASDEKDEEAYYESGEEPDQSIVEIGDTNPPASSTTTVSTTTSVTNSPAVTSKPKFRIPTRKTNGFSSRTRGTTTTTNAPSTTSSSSTSSGVSDSTDDGNRKSRTFAGGNRRNLFLSRNRSNTATTASPTSVPDAAISQSANDESITEVVELVSKAESLSRRIDQQVQSKQQQSNSRLSSSSPQSRTRSRSIIPLSSPSIKSTTPTANTIPTDSRADINSISRSRSRSRYRSTTEQSAPLSSQQQKSLTTTSEPITFRRRLRSSTTPSPSSSATSARTTTTTSTTTRRPSTSSTASNSIKATTKKGTITTTTTSSPDDDEEAEYYYYYYDEDETPSNGIASSDSSADLFDKSQTQRTTGLRTQSFTTGNILDSVPLKPSQPRVTSAIVQTHGDRGFTKRNLQTQPASKNQIGQVSPTPTASSPTPSPSSPASVVVRGNSNGNLNLNSNSFNPTLSHIVNHNWSDRAVVPLSEKIKLRPDGTVECLDKGIFPHPISCKQFVHCVTSEENDGSLRAWVYACPKLLTFDPIGGMCNYDEFAYSKRAPAGNACIE